MCASEETAISMCTQVYSRNLLEVQREVDVDIVISPVSIYVGRQLYISQHRITD